MSEQPIGFADVLVEEALASCRPEDRAVVEECLRPAQAAADSGEDADADADARITAVYRALAAVDDRTGRPRSALCLSGGGIRSATFSLGVLQGLARLEGIPAWARRLDFDYLSTVSGGGYIGSWLSAWIHRRTEEERQTRGGANAAPHPESAAFQRVVDTLRAHHGGPRTAESPQVEYLRDYSNYLNPWLGLLSADTWTLIATYARNLLLNWMVLLPLLALLPLVPQLFTAAPVPGVWGERVALFLGTVLVIVAISHITLDLPSSGASEHATQDTFLLRFLLPLVAGGTLLCAFWYWRWPERADGTALLWLVLFGTGVHWAGAALGWWLAARRGHARPAQPGGVSYTLFAVGLAGALAGLLVWAATRLVLDVRPGVAVDYWSRAYVVLALPTALVLYITATTVFVGLTNSRRTEQDREWWARQCGWLMIVALGWLALAGVSLFSDDLWKHFALPWVGGGSGLLAWILGRSAVTPAPNGSGRSMSESIAWLVARLGVERVAQIAAAVFMLALIAGLSLFDGWLAGQLGVWLGFLDAWQAAGAIVAAFLALALLGALAGWVINVNRFSLHAMYRNRLIRAYLGASRCDARKPHPFTGFDPADDLPMSALHGQRPLHVVNVALNLVKGTRLAWQHRKAESFVVTPRYCGSATSSGKGHRALGFRPSTEYARGSDHGPGISLGTALAISGAAASPNMGYNSSPLVAFVMTLFNARLGWWLGNPACANADVWRSDGPLRNSALPIFKEAFGMTTDTSNDVYLSDGGHFENLGLYEMVLRRCRRIVVVDATCDPEFQFVDLGNAVRKIRIDLGVEIDFGSQFEVPAERRTGQCLYVGTIRYAARDGFGSDGTLLYLKPARSETAPADVLEYARTHPRFPHESTVDQWFNEPQFESYRRLGLHAVETAMLEYRARWGHTETTAQGNGAGDHPPAGDDHTAVIASLAPS